MPRFRFYAGVFLVTSATLMLQVIETRILSVISWYHLAFFAISMAMFGLTAGAVWAYLKRERYGAGTLSYDLAYFSAAFAASTVASLVLKMALTLTTALSAMAALVWALLAVVIAVPYVFSGLTISLALTRSPYPIGRVYGVDLFGAALGCLGVLALLNLTDGPSAAIWVAVLAALGSLSFAGSGLGTAPAKPPPLAGLLARRGSLGLGLALLALANGLSPYGLQPVLVKNKIEHQGQWALTEWNSFSRVSVLGDFGLSEPQVWGPSPKLPPGLAVDKRYMEIDGFASTSMYRFQGRVEEVNFLKYDVTNLAYSLPGRQRAAVIGVGGGRDLLSAWVFGLRDLTGVEINPIFIKLLTSRAHFADYAGLYRLAGVRLVVEEARSWFARTDQTFDLIQMTLADTEAATGAGAFTLSENGLYTIEAFKIFLTRLAPQGVFTVSRWFAPSHVDETGRILSLAVAALLESGAAQPRNHLYLAASQRIATLLLSRSPFSPRDLAALEEAASHYQYQVLLTPGAEPASEVLRGIVGAGTLAELVKHTSRFELDLQPPTDDRPFFFNQLPFYHPVKVVKMAQRQDISGAMQGNLMAALTLLLILLVSVGLVAATIVLPLRPAVREAGRSLVLGGTAYFSLLGIGFMTVEIGLLQRLSVFLGHPIYSLSVVLFSLILFTGLGSLASDRVRLDSPGKFAVWAILTGAYLMGLPGWLPEVLSALNHADLLAKGALCVATLAPAGFLMGFGFPTGIRLASAVDPTPTPWFWGINGAAGVLAASTTVALSLAFGISTALVMGGLCYPLLIPAAWTMGFGGR